MFCSLQCTSIAFLIKFISSCFKMQPLLQCKKPKEGNGEWPGFYTWRCRIRWFISSPLTRKDESWGGGGKMGQELEVLFNMILSQDQAVPFRCHSQRKIGILSSREPNDWLDVTVKEKKITRITPQFLVRAIEYTILLLDGERFWRTILGKIQWDWFKQVTFKMPLKCVNKDEWIIKCLEMDFIEG